MCSLRDIRGTLFQSASSYEKKTEGMGGKETWNRRRGWILKAAVFNECGKSRALHPVIAEERAKDRWRISPGILILKATLLLVNTSRLRQWPRPWIMRSCYQRKSRGNGDYIPPASHGARFHCMNLWTPLAQGFPLTDILQYTYIFLCGISLDILERLSVIANTVDDTPLRYIYLCIFSEENRELVNWEV